VNDIIKFLIISLPEEIVLCFFAWSLLSNRHSISYIRIIVAGIMAAMTFDLISFLFGNNATLIAIMQLISLISILYFLYNIRILESMVVSLITLVIASAIIGTIVSTGLIITGYTYVQYDRSNFIKLIFLIPELAVLGTIALILFKTNIIRLNFKSEVLGKKFTTKMRFITLQLTFTFIILLTYFSIFFIYLTHRSRGYDKLLIILSISVSLIFALITIRSTLKLINDIKMHEAYKKELLTAEVIQNLEYLNILLEQKEYAELECVLKKLQQNVGDKSSFLKAHQSKYIKYAN